MKGRKPSNIERLKSVAFWHWEYQRRNPHYRRYIDVLEKFDEYFRSIGEYDFINSKEFIEEITEYCVVPGCQYNWRDNPIMDRIRNDHGPEAAIRLFKYGFLADKFLEKFKRLQKHYSVGMDTNDVLKTLKDGGDYTFETDDPQDYAAVLRMHSDWAMQLDGTDPDLYTYVFEKFENISVNTEKALDNPANLGLEGHALKLYRAVVEGLFGEQAISDDTLDAVYRLSLSGKYINSSDEMRLSVLWIWDKTNTAATSPLSFDQSYQLLKKEILKSHLSEGVWDQVVTRKKRVFEYYEVLEQCIRQMSVIPFKSS